MSALYSRTVMEHFRRPRNQGALPAPDLAYEAFNPVCGDRIRLELRLVDGAIEAARFRGDACIISIASASILTELLHGMLVADAAALKAETLLAALDAEIRPERVSCALLPLDALRAALRGANGGEP